MYFYPLKEKGRGLEPQDSHRNTVMAYFDNKDTKLIKDASVTGLSAISTNRTPGKEDRKIVAYISRSLTNVEKKYLQTEREALAIVWDIERLRLILDDLKRITLFQIMQRWHKHGGEVNLFSL